MEIQQLYNMALNMIANIKSTSGNMPAYDNMALCLILTGRGQIFTGINGTRIDNGILKNTCAAHSAIMSMMMTQETSAAKLIKVMFRDGSVAVPCEECLRLVYGINDNNKFAEIAVSDTETVALEKLMQKNEEAESESPSENTAEEPEAAPSAGGIMSAEDFAQAGMGFDDEAAEYVDEVELDKSNPFYDAPQSNNVQNNAEQLTGPMQYASIPGAYSQPKALYQTPQTGAVYAQPQNTMQSQMNPMGYNNANTYAQQSVMQPQGNVYTPYPQQGGYFNPYQQAMPNVQQAVPVTPQQMNTVPQGMPVSSQMSERPMNTPYQQAASNNPYYSPMQNDAQVSQQNPYYQAPYQQQAVSGMYSGQVQPVQQSVYSNDLPQSNSVPVNESTDAESIYKKRLSSLLGNGSSDSQPFASGGAENSALMDELKKSAKEKKKNAKIDAKFAKKIKRQGY